MPSQFAAGAFDDLEASDRMTAEVMLATTTGETETGRNKGYKACTVLRGIIDTTSLDSFVEDFRDVVPDTIEAFSDSVQHVLAMHEFPTAAIEAYLDSGMLPRLARCSRALPRT